MNFDLMSVCFAEEMLDVITGTVEAGESVSSQILSADHAYSLVISMMVDLPGSVDTPLAFVHGDQPDLSDATPVPAEDILGVFPSIINGADNQPVPYEWGVIAKKQYYRVDIGPRGAGVSSGQFWIHAIRPVSFTAPSGA